MPWFLAVFTIIIVLGLATSMSKLEHNGWSPVVEETGDGEFIFIWFIQGLLVWWGIATYGWVMVTIVWFCWNVVNLFLSLIELVRFGGLRYTLPETAIGLAAAIFFIVGFALV